MLAGGAPLLDVYLAHYGAPESARQRPTDSPTAAPVTCTSSRRGCGTDLPVPPVLKLFFLMMFLFAVGYVAWIRYAIGSY